MQAGCSASFCLMLLGQLDLCAWQGSWERASKPGFAEEPAEWPVGLAIAGELIVGVGMQGMAHLACSSACKGNLRIATNQTSQMRQHHVIMPCY